MEISIRRIAVALAIGMNVATCLHQPRGFLLAQPVQQCLLLASEERGLAHSLWRQSRVPFAVLQFRGGSMIEDPVDSSDEDGSDEDASLDSPQVEATEDEDDSLGDIIDSEAEQTDEEEEDAEEDEGQTEEDDLADLEANGDVVWDEADLDVAELMEEQAAAPTTDESTDRDLEADDLDDPSLDEDSSANIDRMDYADAYDEEDGMAEASPAASSPEQPNVSATQIALATEISRDMKKALLKLKYRRAEIKAMRPEIAAVVVAKELKRPMEGIPLNWIREGVNPKSLQGRSMMWSAVVTALVVMVGRTAVQCQDEFTWSPGSGPSITASVYQPPPLPTSVPEPEEEAAPMVEDFPVMQQQSSSPILHEHSLRPGERPPSEPIDETGLDKFLTGVGKVLRLR
jgi:hypothetical protein